MKWQRNGCFKRSRREVQIEMDAVLLHGESSGRDSETSENDADFDGVSMFDATPQTVSSGIEDW